MARPQRLGASGGLSVVPFWPQITLWATQLLLQAGGTEWKALLFPLPVAFGFDVALPHPFTLTVLILVAWVKT